jgi:hypothetical protein
MRGGRTAVIDSNRVVRHELIINLCAKSTGKSTASATGWHHAADRVCYCKVCGLSSLAGGESLAV